MGKLNSGLLYIFITFSFLGFYCLVLLSVNAGYMGFTRLFTVPARLVMGLISVILILMNVRTRSSYINIFLLFVALYLSRVFLDYTNNRYFYLPYTDLIFYFFSFCILPFLAISKFKLYGQNFDFKILFRFFLYSAVIFSILSALFYGRFVGNVMRLSSGSAGEEVVSPLILSYCSALVLTVIPIYLFFNKVSKTQLVVGTITVLISTVPFFLGASRGGLLAIFFPLLLLMFCDLSLKKAFIYGFFIFLSIIAVAYFDNYLGSGLLDRFLGTTKAIEEGSSSASRLELWNLSFDQFLNYPIFGKQLNNNAINMYPHNIYLETLQSVGVLGFIPLLCLTIIAFNITIKVFRFHKERAWFCVFFLQAFIQSIFSGALYSSAWFWSSLAMTLALGEYIKHKNRVT